MYTIADLVNRYGVTEHTVLGWIRSGELKALNVGRTPGAKKPRWRLNPTPASHCGVNPSPQARQKSKFASAASNCVLGSNVHPD
jgi:hypothetical protein